MNLTGRETSTGANSQDSDVSVSCQWEADILSPGNAALTVNCFVFLYIITLNVRKKSANPCGQQDTTVMAVSRFTFTFVSITLYVCRNECCGNITFINKE